MRRSRASPHGAEFILRRRRRRAWVFLVLLLVALVLWGAATQAALPGVLQEATNADTWEPSSSGVFDELEQVDSGVSELPESFEAEVLSLKGMSDIRVARHGAVVGFSSAKSNEDTYAAISSELEIQGWMRVKSGSDACGSFIKRTGRYRWVYVSCVAVGDTTSVVVQSVSKDEGKQ